MYMPKDFVEDDKEFLFQVIRDYSFGLLLLSDKEGLEANHVPFFLQRENDGDNGVLQCHLARANPAWKRIQQGADVLAIFQGPQAYVSPSWYPSKQESGKVVPTWNYLAVHAEGATRVIEDAAWLKSLVDNLTTQHEASMPKPWSIDDAPSEYIDKLTRAIVGVEIRIENLIGKRKASQNQPEQNRAGVEAALAGSTRDMDRAMSALIGSE